MTRKLILSLELITGYLLCLLFVMTVQCFGTVASAMITDERTRNFSSSVIMKYFVMSCNDNFKFWLLLSMCNIIMCRNPLGCEKHSTSRYGHTWGSSMSINWRLLTEMMMMPCSVYKQSSHTDLMIVSSNYSRKNIWKY